MGASSSPEQGCFGGRPLAQNCGDGGAPDELEQGKGEARWDFTEEKAFLAKGQGEKRRNWLQKGRGLCWAGLGLPEQTGDEKRKYS